MWLSDHGLESWESWSENTWKGVYLIEMVVPESSPITSKGGPVQVVDERKATVLRDRGLCYQRVREGKPRRRKNYEYLPSRGRM